MPALRVVCRTPWGHHHDLLVLQDHVIVPQLLAHVPSLWWLGDEHHPRVAITLVSALEEETGAALGLSPYCVSTERWNDGARAESWLPLVPPQPDPGRLMSPSDVTALLAPRTGALPLPRQALRHRDAELERGGRSLGGRHGVTELFGWLRRLVIAGLLAAAALALTYYLLATGLWLWSLQRGMDARKVQDGVVLLIAALALSAIVGAFTHRLAARSGGHAVGGGLREHDRQPMLYAILDGFRLGVVLQLLAFAGFVIF